MKYQINYSPDFSVVPVMNLRGGETGVIELVGIYPDGSTIHFQIRGRMRAVSLCNEQGESRRLADYQNADLRGLKTKFGFPFEELAELRNLEKGYRQSQAAASFGTS